MGTDKQVNKDKFCNVCKEAEVPMGYLNVKSPKGQRQNQLIPTRTGTRSYLPSKMQNIKSMDNERLQLSSFAKSPGNFPDKTERETAERIYKEMKKHEMAEMFKNKQYKIEEMPQNFNLGQFLDHIKSLPENCLSQKLSQKFDQGKNNAAAWDYVTLSKAVDWRNFKVDEKVGDKQQPSTAGPGGDVEDMDIMDEEMDRRYEEEFEDMKKSALYSLLLVNYDYFDSPVMTKAQEEYRFLRMIEKEWKQMKREEVKVQKYSYDAFKGLGSVNRPVYAVILAILDNARKPEHAQAAATEYIRLRTMEKKYGKMVPKEVELEGKFEAIYAKIVQTYKCPSSRSFRQAGEFKMVLLEEYKNLQATLQHQRNQISELSSRLSGITNQQIADGEIFSDIGGKNTPKMLGRRFNEIFDDSWSKAYEAIAPKKPASAKDEEKEEYDEAIVVLLGDIIKAVHDTCIQIAEAQLKRLRTTMTAPIVNPLKSEKPVKPSDATQEQTHKLASDFRKAMAPATVPCIQQQIRENRIQPLLGKTPMGKDIVEYVDSLVNIIWYMVIQDPPMQIVWGKKGDKFKKDWFRMAGPKGLKYLLTIWPAVLQFPEGPLLAPGYAVPM